MAWVLRQEKVALPGLDFVVSGNVPMGAGLSSSAALELAMARALFDASGTPWDGRLAAELGQRVENDYIGLKSGIMDQMASALSERGAAMLLDCRDLSIERVPMPEELTVVVMDTGTRREVATSAYNQRRASCEAAVAAVRHQAGSTSALRDVSVELLDAARSAMDETTYRRALHVIRENGRTLEMARSLGRGDIESLDVLMADSHESLRELYEVSSPELDSVVRSARSHPGCRGARMTGAGFGGCAVALVEREHESSFADELRASTTELYKCEVVSGAEILEH
jgi:galactokinase